MRYVLDCSVSLKWFVPELLSEEAAVILGRYQTGSLSLIAPEVHLAEFGHGPVVVTNNEKHFRRVQGLEVENSLVE